MGVHVCEWMCERKEESEEKRLSEGVCVREREREQTFWALLS